MRRRAVASGLYRELDFSHIGKPISTSEVEPVIYLYLLCATSGAPHVNKSRVVFRVCLEAQERCHFHASLGSERRKKRFDYFHTTFLERTIK